MILVLTLGVFVLTATSIVQGQRDTRAYCHLYDPTNRNRVHGRLTLLQNYNTPLVQIKGQIYGLRPGLHGFHVHERGTFGRNCSNAGPHFNPFNQNHAGPSDAPRRHVGDLGNIYANNRGVANLAIYDHFIRMQEKPELSILGRGIVVHADPDDLGRGGNDESLKTGNAGARLACCQIRTY
ncbi:superoxide dismutase [Cu-Zn]-like [Mytilus californianus]|uniref:superoxide dismutase [Cu-Zn]-like n=1 Tax=Mytilus californianus TaxID=6549 RepID=UPI00224575AD|nr:superoxide dismutase [Cu-Zn]-like [Mytilus californianus]